MKGGRVRKYNERMGGGGVTSEMRLQPKIVLEAQKEEYRLDRVQSDANEKQKNGLGWDECERGG